MATPASKRASDAPKGIPDWIPTASIVVSTRDQPRQKRRIEAPLGYCRGLAFSPNGRLLAATGRDALHVWESATGKRLLHLPAKGRLTNWRAC